MSYKRPEDPNQPFHAYDLALKPIFSHPIRIKYLIEGFVPQASAKDLDFSKLKKINKGVKDLLPPYLFQKKLHHS